LSWITQASVISQMTQYRGVVPADTLRLMLLALQLLLVLFLKLQFDANQHSGILRDLQIHLLRFEVDIERVRAISCP